jgi:AP-1 complex subunit gamma-1
MMIEASQGLRVLGINILARFLVNKENNIRFIALKCLDQVVNVDYKAVEKHKTTIVGCMKDADVTIRKKALDLVYRICKTTNIKSIIKELLNYLLTADKKFKEELSNKILMAVEKYSPSKKWQLDTVIKVFTLAGSIVMDNFINSLIALIVSTPELQNYAVNKVYFCMKENLEQSGLQQLGVWLIGEFGDLLVNGQTMDMDDTPITVSEEEAIQTIANVMNYYKDKGDKGDIIIQYSLVALSKLTVRFESMKSELRELVQTCTESSNIETQQRACEFLQLFEDTWDPYRAGIFEPMPFQGNQNMLVDASERALKEEGEGDDEDLKKIDKEVKQKVQVKQKIVESPVEDDDPLGDIFGDSDKQNVQPAPVVNEDYDPLADIFGSGPSTVPQSQPAPQKSNQAYSPLDDIFGMGAPSPAPVPMFTPPVAQPPQTAFQPTPAAKPQMLDDIFSGMGSFMPTPVPQAAPKPQLYSAFQDANIAVNFKFERDPADKSVHKITAVYTNRSSSKLDKINMQVSVKKYLKLQLFTVSNPSLDPGSANVTQEMKIQNTQEGSSEIILRARITYTHVASGKTFVETVV